MAWNRRRWLGATLGGLMAAASLGARTDRGSSFEVYRDGKGEWRWRLKAANGKVIADSAEGYKDRADCPRGIALVRAEAPTARLLDATGAP